MTPATYLPLPPHEPPANDPTLTVDTFIAEVPMDARRSILGPMGVGCVVMRFVSVCFRLVTAAESDRPVDHHERAVLDKLRDTTLLPASRSQ